MRTNARSTSGVVTKAPHFYELYTGPKLRELNAVMASGKLNTATNMFQFVGTSQGPISRGVPANFVFGIDRSRNLPTGPFPNRPNIKFDAIVAATIDRSGNVGGIVLDMAHGTSTTLPSSAVKIQGKRVEIDVPASMLPSTGLDPTQYRFNYWPEYFPGFQANLIASFVPEFGTAQVGVMRARGRR
jgi:hypothetical protein